ncbi:hypothetical protein [Streptomyces sp. AC602_WCS936]|uniref:hypothetical protein n=1 Tax=Streptomyces sp. AC602_WCS936 TaxID=2823685 RepID=UPI001C275B99|nr:hypothetical protein [Streptomyces sp. AC602_WCS936]
MTSTPRTEQPVDGDRDGSRRSSGAPVQPARRPDITPLDEEQRHQVHRVLRRHPACPSCGNRRRWAVGDALPLGFLFLDEDQDAYMVALTCRRRGCPQPRTGIVMRAHDFLTT